MYFSLSRAFTFAVLCSGVFTVSAQAPSTGNTPPPPPPATTPWDTTSVGDKVLIRFSAEVAGLDIDTTSFDDKTYIRALWDSLAREESGNKVYFKPELAPFECGSSSVNYNGHDYSTVLIGTQCWFAENLRTSKYANGDDIETKPDNSDWSSTTDGATTVYDAGGANEATNLQERGRLYNNYAATDARGLCPTGWHVPSKAEFESLSSSLTPDPGKKLKASETDVPDWDGDNTSGFSAIPAGYRFPNGTFNSEDRTAFWTSGPDDLVLQPGNDNTQMFQPGSSYGLSVRCLKDSDL
jgi:uncharacterized protein (TIGR02145 family)